MEQLIKKMAIIACFVICIIFAINRVFFFSSDGVLEHVSRAITYPMVSIAGSVSSFVNQITERKESYVDLQEKYKKLSQENSELLSQNIQLKATLNYSNMSKELRDFNSRYDQSNMKLAKIIVKNLTNDEHYFLIDKGLKDGVKKEMVAIYKLQIVGKIVDVFSHYSKVLLITDQMCKVASYTSKTGSQGIVRGKNNINRCVMNYVSHLFKVEDNDFVLSSGQGLVFPEGFCVGRIVHHELDKKSIYHSIEVEPIVNLQEINFCLLTN